MDPQNPSQPRANESGLPAPGGGPGLKPIVVGTSNDARAMVIYGLAVLAFGALIFGGIAAVIFGKLYTEHRDKDALEAETRLAAVELGRDVARCASTSGALPRTSSPVPARFEQVIDTRYTANDMDWSEPAWQCSGFKRRELGYQIRWIKTDQGGRAVAIAKQREGIRLWVNPVDFEAQVFVSCDAGGQCRASEPTLTTASPGLEDVASPQ